MEKIENNLMGLWKEIKGKLTVTITDIDELDRAFSNTFLKIQRQRERLEISRDMWKEKYMEKSKK